MKNLKILEILSVFDKKEWNTLEKYVHSPFLNPNEEVKRLFQFLTIHFGNWNEETLNEKKIFQFVFLDKPFQRQKLTYVFSYLLQVIENYFAYQEWKTNSFEKELLISKMYQKRNQSKLTVAKFKKIRKSLERKPYRNADFYHQSYELEVEIYKWTQNQTRRGNTNLQELSDTLDVSFVIEKLKRSCTLLTHQALSKTTFDKGLLSMILAYVEQSDLLKIPSVAIYYYSYLTLENPNAPIHFQKLQSLIKKHAELFPHDELKDIFLLSINFCIRQINIGNQVFQTELFKLYKTGLENKVFLENGTLSRWTYKNIVAIGLGLGEFEWINHFINEYKDYIEVQFQESSFNYNLGKLHYSLKEHDKAMKLLLTISETDLLLSLNVKLLLCKIYYEIKNYNALDNLLHSFELYVRRQKTIGYHKQNYLNFIRFLKKLEKLNFFDKEKVSHYRQMLNSSKRLPEKKWLLEQLEKSV